MHLRAADACSDLRLGEVLLETQPEHFAFACVEGWEEAAEQDLVLGGGEAGLFERVDIDRPLSVWIVAVRRIERLGVARQRCTAGIEYSLNADLEGCGDLRGGRRATQGALELALGPI